MLQRVFFYDMRVKYGKMKFLLVYWKLNAYMVCLSVFQHVHGTAIFAFLRLR